MHGEHHALSDVVLSAAADSALSPSISVTRCRVTSISALQSSAPSPLTWLRSAFSASYAASRTLLIASLRQSLTSGLILLAWRIVPSATAAAWRTMRSARAVVRG